MVTTTVSRSLIGGCCPDVGEDTWTSQDGGKLDFFFPPQTQTPPLCACLQLRGPHSEGFDQELQTVSLVLCDRVIYSPDNALL